MLNLLSDVLAGHLRQITSTKKKMLYRSSSSLFDLRKAQFFRHVRTCSYFSLVLLATSCA